jgi:hypothetical protein
VACFEEESSLTGWESCLELYVHTNIVSLLVTHSPPANIASLPISSGCALPPRQHTWLGGAWNCQVDVKAFSEENPDISTDLLTFIATSSPAMWYTYKTDLHDYITCPDTCEASKKEDCMCASSLDFTTMDGPAVGAMMNSSMKMLYKMVSRLGLDKATPFSDLCAGTAGVQRQDVCNDG